MGAPQPVYYGGLLTAQVRHFDARRERPGLPAGVAALVESVSDEGVELTLVNVGAESAEVVVQAGAYGEHRFDAVETNGDATAEAGDARESDEPIEANAVRVRLPAGSRLSMEAEVERFANDPSYEFPWAE